MSVQPIKKTMRKNTYTKYLILVFVLFNVNGWGQKMSFEAIKDIIDLIPESAIKSETRIYPGDLNRDGIKDVILRFKNVNEPIENEHFHLLVGKENGKIRRYEDDIFSFDTKKGLFFDTVTISQNGDFTIQYKGRGNTVGSYRKLSFNCHIDKTWDGGSWACWILNKDEELYQHKIFAPAPQKPIVVTAENLLDYGGRHFFGNIKEHQYDAMLCAKIQDYIPDSTSEHIAYSGDLNCDDNDDIILRFQLKCEDEQQEHYYIFTGQNDGKYQLAAKNDSIYLNHSDGVVFDRVVIKNGYFSLEYSGYGNTAGSYTIITFKYSEMDKNWILHRTGSQFYHRYFTEGNDSKEFIKTSKDFGKILFKDYRDLY